MTMKNAKQWERRMESSLEKTRHEILNPLQWSPTDCSCLWHRTVTAPVTWCPLGFSLGVGYLGSLCLAYSKISDQWEESRCSAWTRLSVHQSWHNKWPLPLREWWEPSQNSSPQILSTTGQQSCKPEGLPKDSRLFYTQNFIRKTSFLIDFIVYLENIKVSFDKLLKCVRVYKYGLM